MPTYDAILPAGGKIDPDFAKIAGVEYKALIDFGGKTLLGIAIDAMKESGVVRSTVVIGPEEVRNHPDAQQATFCLEQGKTGPENMFLGLNKLLEQKEPPKKVLLVNTDLPFLTAKTVADFIARCPDRDICVPLIRWSDFDKHFPGTEATFVKLRDDSWTTGAVFLLEVEAMKRAKPHIDRVFENRKSKTGMAKLLGPVFVLKMLTKRLTLPDVEAKIVSILGCTAAAITDSPPELHLDIDFLDDYEYAMKHHRGEV